MTEIGKERNEWNTRIQDKSGIHTRGAISARRTRGEFRYDDPVEKHGTLETR